MAELSSQYPRYGYRRIAIFLARDGHPRNQRRDVRIVVRGLGFVLAAAMGEWCSQAVGPPALFSKCQKVSGMFRICPAPLENKIGRKSGG
jgi:hypothetical protein